MATSDEQIQLWLSNPPAEHFPVEKWVTVIYEDGKKIEPKKVAVIVCGCDLAMSYPFGHKPQRMQL